MSDDIIDRLRCAYSKGDEPPCEACTFCVARAEIEQLRAELDHHVNSIVERDAVIERLRAAGDQLAYHVRAENAKEMYTAVRMWEEARRG